MQTSFFFFFMQRFITCRFLDVANTMLEITDFCPKLRFFSILITDFNFQRLAALLYAAIPGKECSLGVEIVHCKCGFEMYPMTGVIIRCERFGPHGKSAYKD